MDELLNGLAQLIGVHPSTLVLLLGLLVALANIIGKQIPDDSTGALGVLRVICRAIGLYVSDKVTNGVSVKDVAVSAVESAAAKSTKAQSHWLAAIAAGIVAFLLVGCTTAQTQRVESVTSALCTSVPLAQTAYNIALQNHDTATVNSILTTINLSCPSVLGLIHVYERQQITTTPAPLPPTQPERG